jgi:CheY-like chemotaxis protein
MTSDAPFSILYVEDNPANFRLVEMVFASQPGVTITQADTLEKADRHLEASRPDLVLLDRHMPDGLGTELLERLKAEEPTRDIPVVAITADARDAPQEEFREGGAELTLTKPIDVAELLQVVGEIRGRRA